MNTLLILERSIGTRAVEPDGRESSRLTVNAESRSDKQARCSVAFDFSGDVCRYQMLAAFLL